MDGASDNDHISSTEYQKMGGRSVGGASDNDNI